MKKSKLKFSEKTTKQVLKNEGIISKLNDEQKFYITLISMLFDELKKERIITPTQRGECSQYIMKKLR